MIRPEGRSNAPPGLTSNMEMTMPKAKNTPTTDGGISAAETARLLPYCAGIASGALSGAISTLHLLKAAMKRRAETMDEAGTVENWAAVIGLVTAGLAEPHQDLERCLSGHAELVEAAQ